MCCECIPGLGLQLAVYIREGQLVDRVHQR